MLFHDLQCRSGYGDRLLDLWAASTVAYLRDPDAQLAVRWHDGLDYVGFSGNYATELFSIDGVEFIDAAPADAQRVDETFSHAELNECALIPLEAGWHQIVLKTGRIWGTSCPDQLHKDIASYGWEGRISHEQVVDTYRDRAKATKPDDIVAAAIPEDIETRVGVHVRLHDKLVEEEMSFDMSAATWRAIELSASLYIEQCIRRGEHIFICSDDRSYLARLQTGIRANGGDVVVAAPPPESADIAGYGALVDFFALTRCTRVVQMTKYSTFSIAAALVGALPLVNFYKGHGDAGHRLDLWKSALQPATSQ